MGRILSDFKPSIIGRWQRRDNVKVPKLAVAASITCEDDRVDSLSCPERPDLSETSVSFSSLEIRQYKVVVGDHPSCKIGCPLSLDWAYARQRTVSVDEYEAARLPRRHRNELRLSSEERRDILSEEMPERELKQVERRLQRTRNHDLQHFNRRLPRSRSFNAKLSEQTDQCFFKAAELL